jgi:sec-independent protein translocase protein TatC
MVLILAAIITPPDIISQVIVAIPMIILYEVSIKISKYIIQKQEKEKEKEKEKENVKMQKTKP